MNKGCKKKSLADVCVCVCVCGGGGGGGGGGTLCMQLLSVNLINSFCPLAIIKVKQQEEIDIAYSQ